MKTFLSVFVCFLFTGIFAVENLASPDPGFEQQTKFWYIPKPADYTSFVRDGVNGSMTLKITNTGEMLVKRGGIYRKGLLSVTPGKKYTFEVDFKGELTEGYASALLTVFKRKNGKQTFIKNFETTRVPGEKNQWNRLSMTFTIPEDGELLHLGIFARNFKGTIFFDNVDLREGDAYALPKLSKAPAMDSKWDGNFPANSLKFTDFQAFPLKNDMPAAEKTEVYLAQTHDTIYGMALLYHAPGKILKAKAGKHDGALWLDDCMEFFITRTNTARPYYHFMFNSRGDVYDALENNEKWDSSFRTVSGKLNDSCDFIKFSLPLKEIGYDSELDAHMNKLSWKVNFTRTHQGMIPLYSTFAPVVTFRDPGNFIPLEGLTGGTAKTLCGRFRNSGFSGNRNVRQQRHWKIQKPLYKELFSNKPNPLKGESAFIWPRPIEEKFNTDFAIQYGMDYTLDKILNEYHRNRLHPYTTYDYSKLCKWGEKTGIGIAVYSPYYIKKYAFLYDPKVRQEYFNAVEDILKKYHSGIWALTMGDEAFSQTLRRFIPRANNPKELASDPALRKAVEEIRSGFGNHKYAVPSSVTAEEPFAWIATRRWAFRELLNIQKEIYRLAKKYQGCGGKTVQVISHDHVDWAFLQDTSRFAPWLDIITAQTVPMNDPSRQNIGFRAKLLKDLTRKPVWLCVHVEPYSGSFTSEETAAFISEAARGGNTGLQMWNYDFIADQQGMGSSQFDYYGHRPRWNTIMDILRRMREEPLLDFPAPQYAVLVSNTSAFARPKMQMPQYESFFNIAGPGAGTWFQFISDTQLEDGNVQLKDWKFIVIPKADYLASSLLPKFQNYLENGGTILCFDPKFMEHDLIGNNTSHAREKLFGATTVKGNDHTIHFCSPGLFQCAGKTPLKTADASFALKPMSDTRVLAAYQNGQAAITMKNYPRCGRAILCSVDLQLYVNADLKWRNAFRSILTALGAAPDQKIWRFQYPHTQEKQPEFKDKCLTGNHFYWWNNQVMTPANIRLPQACYSYNLQPDKETKTGKYSFAEGRLTNRLKAHRAGDIANRKMSKLKIKTGKLHRGLFADTWSNPSPLKITFQFGQQVNISRVQIFWNGELPSGKIFVSGKYFDFQGGITSGVRHTEAKIPKIKTDSMVIEIPQRNSGTKLTLSEVEIWGDTGK